MAEKLLSVPAPTARGSALIFTVAGKEIIRFKADGKVLVRGEEAGYAKDILDGLREFLRLAGHL